MELASRLRTARDIWSWRWVFLSTAKYGTASVAARPLTGEGFPQQLMRVYFGEVVRLLGLDIVAFGADKLRENRPAILAVNHNSMLDVPCVGVLFDFDCKWVAKKELFSVPFVGWHLRACGHIPVDRERAGNSERVIRDVAKQLRRGASVLMFPEGTRSRDGALQPFRKGAFVMAVREGVPVIPIAMNGTEKLLDRDSIAFPQGTERVVGICVCDPIRPPSEGGFEERVRALSDATHAAMAQALDELRGAPGASMRPTIEALGET